MIDDEQPDDGETPTIVPTVLRVGTFAGICLAPIVLSWSVLPSWKKIFDDFGVELSSMSVLAIQVSDLIVNTGPLSLISLIGFTSLYAWFDWRLVITNQKWAPTLVFLLLAGLSFCVLIAFGGSLVMSYVGLINSLD